MADELPIVEDVKDKVQAVVEDFKTPRKHLWLLLLIGGGLVALALLIKHSAKKIAPINTASTTNGAVSETYNLSETLVSSPNTPGGSPAPKPKPVPIGKPPPQKPPIPKPGPAPKPTPVPTHSTYTVVSGDTLSAIAALHGTTVAKLYSLNQHTIDAMAKAHGHGPPYDNWIFPGETLYLN